MCVGVENYCNAGWALFQILPGCSKVSDALSTALGIRCSKEGRKEGRVDLNRRSKRFERLTCIRSGDNKVVFLRRCLMVALRICSLALGLLRAAGGGEVLYMPLTLDRTQVVRQLSVDRSREGNGSH